MTWDRVSLITTPSLSPGFSIRNGTRSKPTLSPGDNQVCVGGFIFDWCDEYWKGDNKSVQIGGPNDNFFDTGFAGNYWDEAGFWRLPAQSRNRPMARTSRTFRARCSKAIPMG